MGATPESLDTPKEVVHPWHQPQAKLLFERGEDGWLASGMSSEPRRQAGTHHLSARSRQWLLGWDEAAVQPSLEPLASVLADTNHRCTRDARASVRPASKMDAVLGKSDP